MLCKTCANQRQAAFAIEYFIAKLKRRKDRIYIVDSTSLKVRHNRRIYNHKVFEGMAARGRTTMGWFYGFKLHVAINNKGEIMAIKFTAGNVNDLSVLEKITKNLKGKVFGDKSYISKSLSDSLCK